MTLASERIKAAHRGFSRAEPASRSRIAALDSFGLRYERNDDFNVLVEGQYLLNLAMSYWREVDNEDGCHGYLVSALAAEIRKRNSEKPVAGRDSIAASDRIAASSTTAPQAAIAESAAGPVFSDAGSASRLPAVMP